jgi:hypothetical protein
MEIKPLPGEALQAVAVDAAQISPAHIARAKELIRP